jgi:hypothetical protein
MDAVVSLTGLTTVQVRELADRGVLERSDVKRRFHVTRDSVVRWATGFRPDLLPLLVSDQRAS